MIQLQQINSYTEFKIWLRNNKENWTVNCWNINNSLFTVFKTQSKKLSVLLPWISNHKHEIEEKFKKSSQSSSKVVCFGLTDWQLFGTLLFSFLFCFLIIYYYIQWNCPKSHMCLVEYHPVIIWLAAMVSTTWDKLIDGLVQERRNSIADALELRLSCNNPLIYSQKYSSWQVSTPLMVQGEIPPESWLHLICLGSNQ